MNSFITKLRKLGIAIKIVEGQLKVTAPDGVLTKELVGEIKSHKQLIMDFFDSTKSEEEQAIKRAEESPYYKLSAGQKRLYFLNEFDSDSLSYNLPEVVRIKGDLELDRVREVFNALIARHESLRTSIQLVEGKPFQKIEDDISIDLIHHRIEDEEDMEQVISSFVKVLDLNRAPLMNVGVIEVSSNDFLLVVNLHHIITDGVSQNILITEFMQLYNGAGLPSLDIQYKDYAEWQQSAEYQKELAKQKEFWLNEFQTVPPVLDLPADFVRPAIINTEGDTVGFELGQTDTASLKNLAEANRTTLFVVLFSIYNILLSKLSLQQDIVIGVSSAGRHKSVLENIIGMFVNTLAIRNQVSDQLTFEQLLSNITKKTLQAFNNESYQYEDLIDELKLERDASRNPLFDVMFTFENYDNESLKIDGLEISPYQHDIKESQFDLDLGVVEAEGRLIFQIDYFSKVFRKETVEQFATYFIQIVKVIVSKPSVLVANIDILSAADRRTLLFDFNDTEVGYKAEDTFVGLFERQVADTPDSVAAIHNEDSLSYQELNEYANNIAHSLQARGIKHGQVVPLLMERRINLLAWMIAVQKVGGIFISIDVRNPEARIQKILEDCDPFVVVIESGFENLVGDKDGQIIIIDADSKKNENYNEFSSENVSCEIHHDDIAYIVYTSGSTGKPKGVMIHQHGLVNHLRGLRDRLEVTNQDRFIQTAECSFDVYVVQFLLTLISGGTTHIIDREDVLSADRMMEILNEYPVTLMESVPSLIRLMLKIENENITGKINQLKWLISTGEAISAELVEDWYSKYPLVPIVNAYGPAEVSDDVTVEIIPASTTRNNQISVGKPLPNLRVYILTPSMQLCPIGVPGELYISGAGVGKGYWKDEVKTSERFIPNPFAAELPIGGHDILYKSGDLGRWTANGGITMLGRVDNMVKIRGARVETGEIEQVLNTQNDVTESLVMVKGDLGDEFLTAYYISDSEVSYSELKNHLSSKLPEFMVPSAFVHLSEWPKTLNGKLDRNALPNPEIKLEKSYVEPSTDEQRLLVKVWTEVLGIEGLGITNNFFRAGGDSIKSIQISSRMRAEGYQVTVKDLFTHQTIEELALNLKRVKVQSDQSVVEGEVPLTPIQYRLFDDFKTETHHHNQAVMLNFNQGINADQVNRMFTQIQAHHDALRMVFNTKGSEIQQRNLDLDLEVSIDEYDLVRTENPTVEMERRSNQIQASVDLINGPLMKLGLFHLANGSRLLIVIHHLVVDGVSWRILLEDMETLYGQLIEDKPLNLPLKTDSFQKWSNYLRSYVQSEQFLEAKKYWDKLGEQEIQSIPHDHDLGPVILKDNQYVDFELTTNQTKQLLIDAQVPFGTQINDLLLTALFMAFNKYGNYSTLKVDMEGHGRDTVSDDIDISRTIGWFTSVYPVLLKKNEDGVGSVIKHVKESLRKAPNNGLDYLIDQYLSNKPANDNRSQIIFNYLGQIDGEEDEGPFAISDEPAGDEISLDETRDYDFEFQSIIENGKLKMSLSYSANQFSSKSMESLMNSYEESIQEIINYCAECGKQELTPSDLTFKGLSIQQLDHLQSTYDLEDIYPLSPMQEGMLFHHLLDTSDANYFEQMNCRWSGDIIVEAVEQSMNDLMARYEVLRTVFLHEGFSQPLQLVLKERKVDFKLIDVREECTDKPRREVVSEYCLKDRSQTFNLGKDVLMRLTILHTGEQEYELIWSHHHILMDGWCMGIIFSDFQSIYAGYLGIEKTQLPAVQPYSKYINWLASHEGVSSDDYWSKYLVEYDSQATMLPGNATQEKLPYNKQIHSLEISDDTMSSVTQLSKEHGITLYTLMQTAWGIVLSNYNNTTDVVFGSVVSGRPAEIAGIEDMVGLFINTVPVRVTYDSEDKIIDLLKNVQKVGVSGEEHHYYPLWKIQETNDLGGDLFDHILLFENFPIAETVKDANNASENVYEVDDYDSFDQTNFDLALTITSGATTCVDFEFNASAYQAEYIQSIATHLEQVIKQISLSGGLRIADIEMVTDKEKSLLSQVSNGATIDLPVDKTIVDLINEQVLLTPDQVAVVDGGTSMSYSQLNTESNHLANFLVQEVKIEAGDIVVLHLNKSIELVTSILAIWKTGATFIPVDVNLPNDRISTLLDAIKPNMIITEHELAEINKIARDLDQEIPCLIFGQEISDELELRTNLYSESQLNNYSSNEFINEASQNGLAYLIYTSGSTGQPKAVKIQHRQYLNATLSWRKDYALEDSTVNLLQMANPAFDVFMGDISRSLANGGKMVLCTDQIKLDFPKLASTIEEHQISIFEATPALVFPFLDYLTDNNLSIPSVSLLIVGSDICKFEDFKKHRAELPTDVRIINSYGITETTIDTCFYEEEFQQMSESGIVPIGRPMSGMKVYILNQNLQQQPLNVLGEIYIGGSSVGAGYHNQEELTAMRFIPNPWANGERMYKTGDIGKWLPDYNLELLGRADHQIKIRGFRVELGEIENLLLAHSSVKEAVVVAGENEFGKYLAAYSILEEADVISVKELRDYISNRLPDYMVPAYIIFIEKMPLSTNGKVDRKALPQPSISIDKEARALKTATEQTLADLWSEVLSVNRDIIGTNSSFFELGGHSIKAFHLMNSIQEIFTVRLKLQDLFSNVILSDQARLIDGKDKKEIKAIENIGQKAYFPTSPAQDRLYYQQMLNKDSTVFNNHEALEINGEVQLDRLGKTFKALINRHESLRTSFKFVDGGLTQIIQDEVDFNIEEVELTQNTELEKSLFDFIRPFDLNNGPLLRVGLIKAQDVNLLVFDVHHIVCDGVSLELLVRDFYNIYKGQPLSDLPVRYVDYAHWMKENQVDMEDQMDYWVQKLSGKITPLELPTLHDREEVDIQAADSRSLFIGQELSDAIRALNAETNTSEFMFLISIFYILLEKITASSDIIIGSDVVGRSEDSLKDIVGTFVNLLPLRMQLKEECTYEEFLEGVKSCVLEAYDHQDCQFDDLMNRLGIKAAQNTNPIVQVHFSFDNSVDGEKELTEMDFSPYYNEGTREIQYELELEAARLEEDINITFSYSKQLYDEETIDQLMHYYKNILITVLQQKDISLSAIELESSIEA